MKKILLFVLTGFIICTAFNKPLCIDYRDAYVGKYFCKRSTTSFSFDGAPTVFRDTITIGAAKDALDSIMQITARAKTYQFKLKSGILYGYPDGAHQGGNFFATDGIRFNISLGHASSADYFGKKK